MRVRLNRNAAGVFCVSRYHRGHATFVYKKDREAAEAIYHKFQKEAKEFLKDSESVLEELEDGSGD